MIDATNPHLETAACLRARLVELDLLEQALNAGRDMQAYKLQRLEDLEARLERAQDEEAA